MTRRISIFLFVPLFALAFAGCAMPPVTPTPAPVVVVTTRPAPAPVTPPAPPPAPPVVVTPTTWFLNNQAWLIPLLTLLGGGTGTTIAHALITYFAGGKPTASTAVQAALPVLTQLAAADPKDAATITKLQAALQIILAAQASPPAPSAPAA